MSLLSLSNGTDRPPVLRAYEIYVRAEAHLEIAREALITLGHIENYLLHGDPEIHQWACPAPVDCCGERNYCYCNDFLLPSQKDALKMVRHGYDVAAKFFDRNYRKSGRARKLIGGAA